MRLLRSYRPRLCAIIVLAALFVVSLVASAQTKPDPGKKLRAHCAHTTTAG
ncbi:MAG: hypothetical protein JWO80_1139 [Bryobacterales bacterium]|nr:hypothetical protein [Bryobacterales bacterium]